MNIAIIGGGAAGTITAIHLLRRLAAGAQITLFDPAAELGRGIAYADQAPHFLLNVPAASMSWSQSDAVDFADWLAEQGLNLDPWRAADGSPFLPRALFGRHLQERLAQAVDAAQRRVRFAHQRSLVHQIRPLAEGLALETDAGPQRFSHVIVTIGNAPPAPLAAPEAGGPCVVQSAWQIRDAAISPQDRVVILGAGLTMADCLAELEARGHSGPLACVSRHGRSPRPALGMVPEFTPREVPNAAQASVFLRQFRRLVAECQAQTGDWRAAFTWARLHSAQLWRGLTPQAQRRLRRHARPMWDIHRYLMPPAAAQRMQKLEAEGKLSRITGRALALVPGGLLIRAQGAEQLIPADLVINATGFDASYATAAVHPAKLLDLTAEEAARFPRLGLGVDDVGRLQIAANTQGRIFALGHLVRANHGEMGTINAFGAVASAMAQHLRDLQATAEPGA